MSKFRDTRLYEALDYLDEAYVAEVVENLKVPPAPGMPTRKRGQLRYILALAACLLVLSAAIPVITYVLRNYAEFPGWLVGETMADTSPELTEPETPPEVTTAPPTPETSENIYHETTAPLYHDDCTTAKPEPEYDGSRGLLYQMNEDGKSYYLAGMGICTDEDIVVASTYDGYPVTIIGEDALAGYDRVKSITIPDSVTAIDMRAFKDCTELESITIPDTVYYISGNAFMNCTSLKSIKLPKALELVNPSVFGGCTALEEIVVPDFVTEIYIMAFYKCTNLKSVTLGRRVEKLWADVFRDCENLTEINFAGTMARWNVIEKDDEWNFGSVITVVHCTDGDIKIEPDVTTEPEYDGSVGLEYKVNDDGKSASLVGIGTCTDTEIVVASTYNGLPVTTIAAEAFLNCKKLETVDLGGVSYIGASCFRSCSALRSVKGSENLVEIPACAFQDCDALVEFKFGGKLTSIGSAAFKRCSSLKSIDIPASVTEIGLEAFNVCIALESVTIRGAVKSLHSRVFSSCSRLKSVKLSTGLESITDNAFEYCTSLKGIDIPSSVTLIGPSAFYGCTALEEISIPEGVTSIGDEAFYNCRSLKKVTLPDTLERIHNFAFAYCESLNSVVIPDRVKRIGAAAFRHCIELSSLTLGERVELIEDRAFKDCIALKRLHFPNALRTLEDESFMGCTSITDISYSGNVGEWADVDKAEAWINISTENTVTCADGDVSLSMLTEEEAIEAARKFLNLPASAVLVAKDRSLSRLYCYKIAYCEYAQSVGEFEIKREVYVDQNTGECSEVVYDYPNIPEVFLDVIFNREKFLYVEQTTDSSSEYKYTTSEALFKDHSAHQDHVFGLQTLWYYVTDIDGDSIPELIFPGSARSNYGMLFRVYEGKVYGYACILDGLRTDATYLWHEQAGNYRGRSQVYFDGIFYKSRRLTEYDTNDPNNIIYYVEGKETTKEKYEEYESAFSDEELESFQLDYYPVYVNPYPGG